MFSEIFSIIIRIQVVDNKLKNILWFTEIFNVPIEYLGEHNLILLRENDHFRAIDKIPGSGVQLLIDDIRLVKTYGSAGARPAYQRKMNSGVQLIQGKLTAGIISSEDREGAVWRTGVGSQYPVFYSVR